MPVVDYDRISLARRQIINLVIILHHRMLQTHMAAQIDTVNFQTSYQAQLDRLPFFCGIHLVFRRFRYPVCGLESRVTAITWQCFVVVPVVVLL